jgi:Phage tail protein
VSLQLDITYGEEAGFVPDVAGPFAYATGTSTPAPGVIWRISTGQYAFWWQVPLSGLLPGVYIANWTATYGTAGDAFLSMENFPVESGAPFTPVPSADTGFWTGSLSYQPSWAPAPFVIPLGGTDASGTAWILEKVDGWDSPPSVGSVIQRSADHGGWPAAQYYGPRIITLTVMASAQSQPLRDVARAQLQQAVAIGTSYADLTTFTWNEPVPLQALVRRNGSAAVTEARPTLTDVVFTIPLVAPDPRKYSVTPQSVQVLLPSPPDNPLTLPVTGPAGFPGSIPAEASAISVTNAGTFETRPQLTVTGPIQNPAVVNVTLGQSVSFTGLVMESADTLTIDTDSRQCFLDGTFYPADPDSSWWVLEPGTSVIYLGGNSTGGAGLTCSWSSAWI